MELLEAIDCFSALANQARLRVFRTLVQLGEPTPAGALAEYLQIPESTLSFHLKELRLAGLIERQRDGRKLLYQAQFTRVAQLQQYLLTDCCHGRIS